MQKEAFPVAETQLCCLYQTNKAINFCLSLISEKSTNVNAFQDVGLRQKGAYERLTTEFFSALCQCLVSMLHVELIMCGLLHLSPSFNHLFRE